MEEGDRSFNEQVQEVQRQILLYKECTDKKLKKLEEMMDLAVQKMSLLKRKFRHHEDRIVNPFDWKEKKNSSRIEQHSNAAQESLYHHNLQIPKFEGETEVTDWLEDCEQNFEVSGISNNKKAGMHLEGLPKSWYQAYVGGLHKEVKDAGRLLEPTTVGQAFKKAKYYEQMRQKSSLTENYNKSNFSVKDSRKGEWSHMHEWPPVAPKSVAREEASEGRTHSHEEQEISTTYIGEPIYDEEPGEDKECWPEHEHILEAINRGNSKSLNLLQLEGCYEDTDCNNLEEEDELNNLLKELSGSSMKLWSSEIVPGTTDNKKHSVGNDSREKFKMDEHAPLLNEIKLIDIEVGISASTKEEGAAQDLNTVIMDESAHFLEPTDLSRPLSYPFEAGQIEWIQVGCMKPWPSQVVHGHGDKSTIVVDYKGEEQQLVDEEITSMILTNLREIAKDFFNKITSEDSLKDTISYGFNKMPSKFCQKDVLIFDPGGYGSNVQQTCAVDMFTALIRNRKVKLDEVAMKISTCDLLAIEQLLKEHHPELRKKVFVIQMVNSTRVQGQDIQKVGGETDRNISEINEQYVDSVVALNVIPYRYKSIVFTQYSPEINKVIGLKYHKVSRRSVEITIFDRGGCLSCVYGAGLVNSSPGTPNVQQLLQDVLHGKELYKNKSKQEEAEMYLIQMEQRLELEVQDPP